ISSRHGAHQVAQRLRSTVLPRKSFRVFGVPASSTKLTSASGSGAALKTKAGRPGARRRVAVASFSCRGAAFSDRLVLSGRPSVPYTAAKPTRAAIAAMATTAVVLVRGAPGGLLFSFIALSDPWVSRRARPVTEKNANK